MNFAVVKKEDRLIAPIWVLLFQNFYQVKQGKDEDILSCVSLMNLGKYFTFRIGYCQHCYSWLYRLLNLLSLPTFSSPYFTIKDCKIVLALVNIVENKLLCHQIKDFFREVMSVYLVSF